jgi:hypothetical protein
MDLDVPFPGAEFLLREQIATAGLFETDDTAPYRSDDRGFASRYPTFCVCGWQIGARLQHDSPE